MYRGLQPNARSLVLFALDLARSSQCLHPFSHVGQPIGSGLLFSGHDTTSVIGHNHNHVTALNRNAHPHLLGICMLNHIDERLLEGQEHLLPEAGSKGLVGQALCYIESTANLSQFLQTVGIQPEIVGQRGYGMVALFDSPYNFIQ